MNMDLSKFEVKDVVQWLQAQPNVPPEIPTAIVGNCIDGQQLLNLIEDVDEFKEVLPKAGHRLRVKGLVCELRNNSPVDLDISTSTISDFFNGTFENSGIESPNLSEDLDAIEGSSLLKAAVDLCQQATNVVKQPETLEVEHQHQHQKLTKNIPEPVPFPDRWSPRVQAAIDSSRLPEVRKQFITDAGGFYYGMCKHPAQGDYRRIAIALCNKFPVLRDPNDLKFYLSIQHQLSMYFRNTRRTSSNLTNAKKRKTVNVAMTETEGSSSQEAECGKLPDPVAEKRNLQLLKTTPEKDFSPATFSNLLEETHEARREFIKEALSIKAIVETCPYLQSQKHITNEMKRIVGKERVKTAYNLLDEAAKRLLQKKDGEVTNEDLLNAIEKVEKATKRVGAKPIVTFFETAAKPEKMFKSSKIEPKIICLGTREDMRQFFIAAEDDCLVELPNTDLGECLLLLLFCYYVFDVRYPVCYFGILTFLQDIVLKLPDNTFRGSKFSSFISKFNSLPRVGM